MTLSHMVSPLTGGHRRKSWFAPVVRLAVGLGMSTLVLDAVLEAAAEVDTTVPPPVMVVASEADELSEVVDVWARTATRLANAHASWAAARRILLVEL